MEQQKKNTALLVMDMQVIILHNFPEAPVIIKNVARAITEARNRQIPVIYVVLGFRSGAPEISVNNKIFSGGNKERWTSSNMEELTKILPELAPKAEDIVITKRRVSAFTGSDLDVVLRAQNIGHLILTGCSTSGVVLSTIREASDKDFRITILSDGCADRDEEVHRVLTTKVFPRQADVLTIDEWKIQIEKEL